MTEYRLFGFCSILYDEELRIQLAQATEDVISVVYHTVEDRGRVMEIGVGGEEEQVGAVGPGHGVEDQLPRALWHLGSIFGQQPTPLSERLQREQRERR